MIRCALTMCLAATPVVAATTSQTSLAEEIETLGTHQTETDRHVVEIDDCRMRKFLWKSNAAEGEILWSALDLDIADLAPPDGPDPSISIVPFPDRGMEMIIFTMLPGTLAQQEIPRQRNPKPPYQPSPRENGDAFVIKDKDGFLFSYEQVDPGRMTAFADALFTYRRTYCVPTG